MLRLGISTKCTLPVLQQVGIMMMASIRCCGSSSSSSRRIQHQQRQAACASLSMGRNHVLQDEQQSKRRRFEELEQELFEIAQQEVRRPLKRGVLQQPQSASPQRSPPSVAVGHDRRCFVASAVLATPGPCSCGAVCMCPPLLRFIGINSALHRQINNSADDDVDDFGAVVIKGLLKGCAEQNALGAFAASGHSFEQVRGLVICSVVMMPSNNNNQQNITVKTSPAGKNEQSTSSSVEPQHHQAFPCTACRNYLKKVHAFVAARHESQVLRLCCLSLHHHHPKQQQQDNTAVTSSLDEEQISVNCLSGWRSEFRQDVL